MVGRAHAPLARALVVGNLADLSARQGLLGEALRDFDAAAEAMAPISPVHHTRLLLEKAEVLATLGAHGEALTAAVGALAVAVTRGLEAVRARGFVYMDTPGYDPVSATGQVAGGANLICFTTGRGSAYGCAPSPSLKLSTNTALWTKQQEDIDIDCGTIVDGLETVDEVGERIFRLMLDTASGRATKSELHGYGQNEFVPWQLGAVM